MDQAFNLAKALSEISSPPPSSTRTTFSQTSTSTATTTGKEATTKSISTAPGPPVNQDAMSPRSRSRPRPLPLDLHTAPRSLGLDDDQSQSPLQFQSQSPSTSRYDVNQEVRSPIEGIGGQSIATELRLRIQRDKERERGSSSSAGDGLRGRGEGSQTNGALAAPILPPRSSSRLTAAIASSDSPTQTPRTASPPTFLVTDAEESDDDRKTPQPVLQPQPQSQSDTQIRASGIWEVGHDSGSTEPSPSDLADSEQSTIIETPIGPNDGEQEQKGIITSPVDHDITSKPERESPVEKEVTSEGSPPGLASPIPLQGGSQSTSSEVLPGSKLPTPQLSISPDLGTPYSRHNGNTNGHNGGLSPGPMSPSSRNGLSPDMASLPGSPFSPGSPASPHSVTATRQAAAEITRSAAAAAAATGPVPAAGRITTLLGRTEDLLGSRGPVPITFHMGSPGGFRSTGPTMSPVSSSMAKEATHGLGLGLPSSASTKGRISPSGSASGHGPLGLNEFRRATSPLIGSALIEHPSSNDADSRFPRNAIPSRNMSSPAQTYTTPTIPSRVASPDLASVPAVSVPVPPNQSTKTTTTTTVATSQSSKKKSENPGTTSGTGTGTGLFPRARSRSFGATVAKAMGRGKKEKEKDKERPPPPPAINTALSPKSANVVALPSSTSNSTPAGSVSATAPGSYRPSPGPGPAQRKGSSSSDSRPIRSGVDQGSSSTSPKAPRRPSSPAMPPSPLGSFVNGGSPRIPTVPLSKTLTSDSAPSPRSATSPGFPSPTLTSDSHSGAGSKTPRKASKTLGTSSFPTRGNVPGGGPGGSGTPTSLASPVSHRDYAEETVKADGLDFELVQPRKASSSGQHLSPVSPVMGMGTGTSGRLPSASESYPSSSHPNSKINGSGDDDGSDRPGMKRSETFKSDVSGVSGKSVPLAETDEWGFIKDQSPTPEMYQSRSTASDHRSAETKWVSLYSTSPSIIS